MNNLPDGWETLHPARDVLPALPDSYVHIEGLSGVVPLVRRDNTIIAVYPSEDREELIGEAVDEWNTARWNEVGAEWLKTENDRAKVMMNWVDWVFRSGVGGVVTLNWKFVSSVDVGEGVSFQYSEWEDDVEPVQFTFCIRYTRPANMYVTRVRQYIEARDDSDEGLSALMTWNGFARRYRKGAGDDETTEAWDLERYGEFPYVGTVHDAHETGVDHGKWYSLTVEDDDIHARQVSKGTPYSFQAIVKKFAPQHALQQFLSPVEATLSEADYATSRMSDTERTVWYVAFWILSALCVGLCIMNSAYKNRRGGESVVPGCTPLLCMFSALAILLHVRTQRT